MVLDRTYNEKRRKERLYGGSRMETRRKQGSRKTENHMEEDSRNRKKQYGMQQLERSQKKSERQNQVEGTSHGLMRHMALRELRSKVKIKVIILGETHLACLW